MQQKHVCCKCVMCMCDVYVCVELWCNDRGTCSDSEAVGAEEEKAADPPALPGVHHLVSAQTQPGQKKSCSQYAAEELESCRTDSDVLTLWCLCVLSFIRLQFLFSCKLSSVLNRETRV